MKHEAGNDTDRRGRKHDPKTTAEDHRCEDCEWDQEESKVAQNRPGWGEIRIGEKESPFAGAGADACHQLDNKGGGSENTDRSRYTQADQALRRAACGDHDPNSECGGQNEEVPGIGGYHRSGTDPAERSRNHPFPIIGFDAEPAPGNGSDQHRKGDEMTVDIGKEAGPKGVLIDR